MEIKEALEKAIAYEQEVRDAYKEAMKLAENPEIKALLSQLAVEEHGHVLYLEEAQKLWQETGEEKFPEPESALDREAIETSLIAIRGSLLAADKNIDLMSALFRALNVEEETYLFYKKLAEELSPEHKKAFDRFVRIENKHLVTVRSIIDAFSK